MRSLIVIAALVLTGCQSAPQSTTGSTIAAPAGDVVGLVNAARAEQGLGPVRTNPRLAQAARDHAADMVAGGYFSHTGQNGSSFSDRARAAGYACAAAENIASGQRSEAEVMTSWLNSPGHRRNILLRDVVDIGIGRVGTMWVMMLGRVGC